ncbi:hypothetical protein [Kineothrix sedimenti]|uniref:Collagen triple helix repeat protein n=1 Tax=Kineothrix sedimenti TaxID=3123317 RepID=A0ABZ3ESU5_9FIRM
MQKGFQKVYIHSCGDGVIATPVIGENGNWYVGNEDTGVKAEGIDGKDGEMGPEGPQGPKGEQGDVGPEGPQGLKGDTGAEGAQGPKGEKGDKGDQGEMGPQGPQGDTGATGIQGPKGDTGATGPQGPIGETPALAANLTTTVTGKALDATMGKVLDDKITTTNNNLTSNINAITGTWLGNNKISFDGTNFYATASNGVKKKLGDPQIVSQTWEGSNTATLTFGFSTVAGYAEKTAEDFFVQINSFSPFRTGGLLGTNTFTLNKSYNAVTGVLTLTGLYKSGVENNFYVSSITVYTVAA